MANRNYLADLEELNDDIVATRRDVVDLTGDADDDDDDQQTAAPLIDLSALDDEEHEDPANDEIQDIPVDANISKVLSGCNRLDSVQLRRETLFSGDAVELKSLAGDSQTFLCDVRIFLHTITGEVFLHGIKALRTTNPCIQGMFSNRINELCLVLNAPPSTRDPTLNQCRVLEKLAEAHTKRKIILTNRPFPACSVYEPPYYGLTKPELRAEAQLVCRWRLTQQEMNSSRKVTTGSVRRLSTEECDRSACDEDVLLLRSFLAQKQKPEQHERRKRTHNENLREEEEDFHRLFSEPTNVPAAQFKKRRTEVDGIDLTTDSVIEQKVTETIERLGTVQKKTETRESTVTKAIRTQRSIKSAFCLAKDRPKFLNATRNVQSQNSPKIYTFGDICSGAGGTASGAVQAGLRLNFLLDKYEDVCETLRINFDTQIIAQDVHKFCHPSRTLKVGYEECDVLHISFPCQSYSPANTKGGKDFDDNIATGYSVGPILKRCMPRIVTFEQTDGMLERHEEHFRALIRQLTDEGYSVRWKVCRAADYENVQKRSRLILIAACPGEILPQFPETTHGPGKRPYVTIQNVLDKIDRLVADGLRIPPNLQRLSHQSKTGNMGFPYDARRKDRISCITTHGGDSNLHPSGARAFTLFELAQMQGFPPNHRFFGSMTSIRKQIGNAWASSLVKLIYESVISTLEDSDRRSASWKPETINLDSD